MAYEAFSFTPQGEQALLLSGVLLSSEDEIGARLAAFEYIKRDGAEQEPMGAAPAQFTFRIVITGSAPLTQGGASLSATERYAKLGQTVRTQPRGILNHPRLGRWQVAFKQIRSREEPKKALDTIEATLVFVEDQLDQAIVIDSTPTPQAQANRTIGIARAAFYPNISFRLGGGFEDEAFNLFSLANSFWSYGSGVSLPLFQGGYRRAQLQQSWSAYRETEDRYRSTVLNAFREVENNLSLTNRLTLAANRQDAAVGATLKTQDLTMELYQGGLASSLELIYAQVAMLTARIESVQIKAELLRTSVALIRSLGGGWNRQQLPTDDQIQPFGTFQYTNLEKPLPVGGIDVNAENNRANNDLTKPVIR